MSTRTRAKSRATRGTRRPRRSPLRGRTRSLRLLLAVLMGSVVLSGCDFDVYDLPLPGGADTGEQPITVTAEFRDVLDLVPKSTVKVNDVDVGQVSDITLDGYTARVTLELRRDTKLPDNALAEIRQTSLLGEKFVSLSAPADAPSAQPLGDRDVIPLERTGRNPEVEEVLGALSLVLNGGGIAQLRTIARELNAALGGREDAARSVLTQVDTLTENLDTNKADIVQAIEALNRLSIAANEQIPTIDAALAELPSALQSIDAQRADLVRTLQALDQLSGVAVGVIQQSKDATIASVKQLQPVLTALADSGSAFVNAFNTFYAYPFVDEVVGRDPQVARNLHMGDYVNLDLNLDVDLSPLLPTALPTNLPVDLVDAVQACLATGLDLNSQACRSLVGDTLFREYCSKPPGRGTLICTLPALPIPSGAIPSIPIPSLPLPSITLPSLPLLGGQSTSPGSGLLPGLPLVGGLFRAAPFSSPAADGTGGPTVAQLQSVYDADLVNLMAPGMMTTSASAPTADAAGATGPAGASKAARRATTSQGGTR